MGGAGIGTVEEFVRVHAYVLAASGIPECLHRQLFQKLSSETLDGGSFFQVEACEEDGGRQRRLLLSCDHMRKDSQLFLIDHAWTFRLLDACKQLRQIPGLLQRMASLMCVDHVSASPEPDACCLGGAAKLSVEEALVRESEHQKRVNGGGGGGGADAVRWLELEDLGMDDAALLSLHLPTKFPNLSALSLCGNNLGDADIVAQEILRFKHLRALWLNDNPILRTREAFLADAILKGCPSLEIYNSCFTHGFGVWALGFCGGLVGKDIPGDVHCHLLQNLISLDLSDRCIHNLINEAFSPAELPRLSSLNIRGNPLDQNSASDLLNLLKDFPLLNALEVDIPGPLGKSALDILKSLPDLSTLNGVDASTILETRKHVVDSLLQPRLPEWTSEEPLIDRVISAMWLFMMSYRLADEEKIDETSVWYIMDELGSALRHSDEPNFRLSPFLYMPTGKLESAVSYCILWPTQNVQRGDECTRDFLFGIGEDKQRSARLSAWFVTPKNYFIQEYEKHCQKMYSRMLTASSLKSPTKKRVHRNDGFPLRVYTDIPQVEEFLTRSEFVITLEPKDADILWTSMQIDEDTRKAAGITDQQYTNQFPFEACLVMKHHLAETVQKVHGSPEWFQPTYNLETHLSQLIGDYYVRERDGFDNLWILKPWNMARTIDTTVTGNLSAIIRLMETGPKICQKYIERPALLKGRKFDLRYIVLVRSMDPLEIFICDVFWVRLANNNYSLDKCSLFDYETHFTVMNYCGRLNHMNTPEFVKQFEQEHQVKWLDIHLRIKNMIRSVFEAAKVAHPEMQCSSSRAMYGVDVMLDCSFQPKLLEVTYCPDCTRACKYDTRAVVGTDETVRGSEFFNYVFGCLFLNETVHVTAI